MVNLSTTYKLSLCGILHVLRHLILTLTQWVDTVIPIFKDEETGYKSS